MMKAWITMAAVAGFMGAMGMAQAGVPAEHAAKAPVSKVSAEHATHAARLNDGQSPSSNAGLSTSKPSIPGAHEAQSASLNYVEQMAIVGGVILVAGAVFAATSNGNSSSTTPGTGGPTGTTGTTGTN